MAAPTKTLAVVLLSPASLTNNGRLVGTAVNVSGVHSIGLTMWLARLDATAHASPWAQIVVEGSPESSGTSMFSPIARLVMPAGASIAATTNNGAISAGATSFVVTSATNIAAVALLWIGDITPENWEIVRVQSVSTTTINIDGAFQFNHTTGYNVVSQAEIVTIPSLDVTGLAQIRVACLNQSGRTVIAKATGVTTVL